VMIWDACLHDAHRFLHQEIAFISAPDHCAGCEFACGCAPRSSRLASHITLSHAHNGFNIALGELRPWKTL
jgi:hypothetical protein